MYFLYHFQLEDHFWKNYDLIYVLHFIPHLLDWGVSDNMNSYLQECPLHHNLDELHHSICDCSSIYFHYICSQSHMSCTYLLAGSLNYWFGFSSYILAPYPRSQHVWRLDLSVHTQGMLSCRLHLPLICHMTGHCHRHVWSQSVAPRIWAQPQCGHRLSPYQPPEKSRPSHICHFCVWWIPPWCALQYYFRLELRLCFVAFVLFSLVVLMEGGTVLVQWALLIS